MTARQGTKAPKRDPWDRREAETDPAWQAFTIYRDMGLTRSTAKVAQQLGKSKTLMDRWSRTHSWVIRCHAYDVAEDRAHRLAMRAARVDAERRNLRIAQGMMGKAAGAIATLNTADLKPQDIARFVEAASKLEAMTLGTATEITHVSGPGGGAVQVDVGAMSDEDRHARMLMLRRELDNRLREHDSEDDDTAGPDDDL